MKTRIFVLFGVIGSGKDTVGDYLVKHYGFQKDSFAAPLKEMAKIAFPRFTEEDLWGSSKNRNRQYLHYPFEQKSCLRCGTEHKPEEWFRHVGADHVLCPTCGMEYPKFLNPRIVLQTLGTEWGRRLLGTIWVDSAMARAHLKARAIFDAWLADPSKQTTQRVEARFVITDGRFFNEHQSCRASATTVLLLRNYEESTSLHESETSIKTIPQDQFHYVLDNRCSLEELPERIDGMVAEFGLTRSEENAAVPPIST